MREIDFFPHFKGFAPPSPKKHNNNIKFKYSALLF